MFAESTPLCLYERSIYIMNISFSRPFLFLISIILYLYTKRKHSFPHLPFPAPFLPFLYSFIIYTLYIERNILSRNFLLFSRPFLTLYYTPIIYREWYTLFPPLFYPFIKWTPLHRHFPYFYYSLGKSLRGKVFKNFISIVL